MSCYSAFFIWDFGWIFHSGGWRDANEFRPYGAAIGSGPVVGSPVARSPPTRLPYVLCCTSAVCSTSYGISLRGPLA